MRYFIVLIFLLFTTAEAELTRFSCENPHDPSLIVDNGLVFGFVNATINVFHKREICLRYSSGLPAIAANIQKTHDWIEFVAGLEGKFNCYVFPPNWYEGVIYLNA